MSKKFKKSAKELERLANLYQKPAQDNPSEVVSIVDSSGNTQTNIQAKEQMVIKHDLLTLAIVTVVVLLTMFALNYLIDNTALGGILTSAISRII